MAEKTASAEVLKTVECRQCGQPIVWLKTKSGKSIPTEPINLAPGTRIFDRGEHESHFPRCQKSAALRQPAPSRREVQRNRESMDHLLDQIGNACATTGRRFPAAIANWPLDAVEAHRDVLFQLRATLLALYQVRPLVEAKIAEQPDDLGPKFLLERIDRLIVPSSRQPAPDSAAVADALK